MCEDMPRFSKHAESAACKAAQISPLARAALDNGVSFDDVYAYLHDAHKPIAGMVTLALNNPRYADWPERQALVQDITLDAALARSFLAQCDGSVAAARLWWQGVLP
jgi:hypothetical protein